MRRDMYSTIPVDDTFDDPGSGGSQIPSSVTEYRRYYYETANLNLGDGAANWAYSLYPPEASAGQYFDFSLVMRLQDGFSSQTDAANAARLYIDGIVGGSIIEVDPGDDSGIGGIDIPDYVIEFPDPPTAEEQRDFIGGGSGEATYPHDMFDCATGKKYIAYSEVDHTQYANLGYVHAMSECKINSNINDYSLIGIAAGIIIIGIVFR